MSRVKAYKNRRETLLDNKRMLDFMALSTDKPAQDFHTRIPDPPKPRVKSSAVSEADVNADIREWSKAQPLVVLYRNNRGAVKLPNGGMLTYGVGPNGGSDWLGYQSVLVTEDMVGRTIAVFVAIEAKRPGKSGTDAQDAFCQEVREAGGKAGVVHSVEELARILGE
jgi:hypothetical protein